MGRACCRAVAVYAGYEEVVGFKMISCNRYSRLFYYDKTALGIATEILF